MYLRNSHTFTSAGTLPTALGVAVPLDYLLIFSALPLLHLVVVSTVLLVAGFKPLRFGRSAKNEEKRPGEDFGEPKISPKA